MDLLSEMMVSEKLPSEKISSQKVDGLDYTILDPAIFNRLRQGMVFVVSFGYMLTKSTNIDLNSSEGDETNTLRSTNDQAIGKNQASFTLACVISKSDNKQCIETAVRTILHHSSNRSVDLIIKAANRYVEVFRNLREICEQDESVEISSREGMQLSASGYGRILASMAVHCSDHEGLANRLCGQPGSETQESETFLAVGLEFER